MAIVPASRLRARMTFQARTAPSSDDFGNEITGGFADQFTRWAQIRPLKGGEGVQGARLQGTQPALVIVRRDSQTATITPDWRAVDAHSGRIYAIRTAEDMEQRGEHITCMCEAGVAA